MKKWLSTALMIMLGLTLLLTACGGKSNPAPAPSGGSQPSATPAETVTIKFSLSQAASEPTVLAAQEFKKIVEERSNGSIVVEVYPDNQLGSERDAIEGLQLHTVEMVAPANAVMTNFLPRLNLLELPMLFESKQHVYAVLDDVGLTFADECNDQGFKLFGFFDLGSRNIMTVKKIVNSIDDLHGLKIRTQEGSCNMAAFTAFGAKPTPMAYNELYTALESGVLDGAEAANTNYVSKAFYEVAPNWAVVGWLECVNPVLMDAQFWNKLSADQQAIVEQAVHEMIDLERVLYAQSEDDAMQVLLGKDVNITYPDKAPFKEASQHVYEEFADLVGGIDKIEAILNYQY